MKARNWWYQQHGAFGHQLSDWLGPWLCALRVKQIQVCLHARWLAASNLALRGSAVATSKEVTRESAKWIPHQNAYKHTVLDWEPTSATGDPTVLSIPVPCSLESCQAYAQLGGCSGGWGSPWSLQSPYGRARARSWGWSHVGCKLGTLRG